MSMERLCGSRQTRIFLGGLLWLAFLLLSGCASQAALPHAHEIEHMLLIQALGVDVGTAGVDGVAVAASSGARPTAGDSPGQSPVVLSAQANTVSAACAEMQTFGRDDVFYGDVEQLLVGEDQALRGLDGILEHMARDQELRLEAQAWVVRGASASDALFAAAEGGGAAGRLSALQNDDKLFAYAVPRTAREALVDLLDNGCTFLPALALEPARPGDGAEGERELVQAGYALFRDGALCGWAEGEAAWGMDLLLGEGAGEVLELVTPGQDRVALKISGVRTRLEPVFDGDRLTGLRVSCGLQADVMEFRGTGNLNDDTRSWLSEELGRVAQRRLRAALEAMQTRNADVLHLKGRAALAAPWAQSALEEQWKAAFAELEVAVEAEGRVARRS